jgi:hypothetical protein
MKYILSLISFLLIAIISAGQKPIDNATVCMSAEEHDLYELVMQYRAEKGLPSIPASKSLTYVAQSHAKDLEENDPATDECNLHSWSGEGPWNECCYTSDHAQARCMWDKPKELTHYPGAGYEISYMHSSQASPDGALRSWKTSSGHNAVIINEGIWNEKWDAIGIGIYGKYAVIWFGNIEDPDGEPDNCD